MNRLQAVLGVLGMLLAGPAGAAEQAIPPVTVKPAVKPYKVAASLKGVANVSRFQGTAAQKALLARNLFVVTPTKEQQLFFIYENNDYGNIPSFVTTDLVLQLYHVFFDFTLRKVEHEKLLPLARQLARGLLAQSLVTWKEAEDPDLKAAALRNVAYCGVAAGALGVKAELPAEAASLAQKDLALIEKHEDYQEGSIFPYRIDFSQFVPRGHYTRTPAMKQYFKGMMWYGLAPFALYRTDEKGTAPCELTTRMGLLLTRDLYRANLQDTWRRIYEPTAFYVGAADDLTPADYRALSDKVFGKDAPLSAFADKAKLRTFIAQGKKLRAPGIKPRFLDLAGGLLPRPDAQSPQLRLMGQRYIPDSEMTQRLTVPVERYFPAGMDVMAVLGSPRARWLLDVGYPDQFDTKEWKGYRPERAKLEKQFAAVAEKQWTRNMYWGWLWAMQALLPPAGQGYPSFMRGTAWQDKSLNTALASWAELRHDTILYAKQSMTSAECGGGDKEPPPPKGYVEPNVEFYRRLQMLTRLSKDGLLRRDLLDSRLKEKFEGLEDMLAMLRRISEKELRSEKLTREEYLSLKVIGAEVERLTLAVVDENATGWQEIASPVDRNMAVVADVHTGGLAGHLEALEEGVGHANEILAIVPVEGKLQITRGAVFSYYEFRQPIEERLTDEKWQEMLRARKPPTPPAWTKSFLAPAPKGGKDTMKVITYSSGC